jgi:hypothetical protein
MNMSTSGLDDAYNSLNLGLENKKNFDRYFVFTEPSASNELVSRFSIDKEPSKSLLTGIKGCGKTTELLRLLRELDEKYFGVFIAMRHDADIRKVTAPDILLSGLLHLYISATERNVKLKPETVHALATWLQETHSSTKVEFADMGHEQKGLWERVKKAMGVLKAQRIRDAVQGLIEERKGDLIETMNKLIAEVEASTGKKVLLAFDDLDKLPLEKAKAIFAESGELLSAPACKIVYTVPYSLLHTHDFREVSRVFKKHVNQVPVQIKGKEKDGQTQLRDILSKRLSLELIDAAALDSLIARSGGVVGDLLRWTSESCIKARTDGKEKIDIKVLDSVLDDYQKDASRSLGSSDCEVLSAIYTNKIADNNDTFLRLLDEGYILEYPNDEGHYYVHPQIMPILEDRKVIFVLRG